MHVLTRFITTRDIGNLYNNRRNVYSARKMYRPTDKVLSRYFHMLRARSTNRGNSFSKLKNDKSVTSRDKNDNEVTFIQTQVIYKKLNTEFQMCLVQ